MMYGYLSVESDLETVAGISFYKHGETPGLGAEIEKHGFYLNSPEKNFMQTAHPQTFVC